MTRADRKRAGLPAARLGRSFFGLDPSVVEEVFRRQTADNDAQQLFLQQLIQAEQARQEQLRLRLTSVESDLRVEEAQAAHLESAAKLADDTGEIIREAVQRYLRVLEGEAAERRSGLEARVSELKDQVRQTIRQLEASAEQMGTLAGGDRSGSAAGLPSSAVSPAAVALPPAPASGRRPEPPVAASPSAPLPATPPFPALEVDRAAPAGARSNPTAGGRVVLFRTSAQQADESGGDATVRDQGPPEPFRSEPEPIMLDVDPPSASARAGSPTPSSRPGGRLFTTTAGPGAMADTTPLPSLPDAAAFTSSRSVDLPMADKPPRDTQVTDSPAVGREGRPTAAPKAAEPSSTPTPPASPGTPVTPRLAEPSVPSSTEQVAAGIKGRLAMSMARLLEGKVVGQDLRDDGGNLVAARGARITPELTARVEAVGLLPDLILHMVWSEEVEA